MSRMYKVIKNLKIKKINNLVTKLGSGTEKKLFQRRTLKKAFNVTIPFYPKILAVSNKQRKRRNLTACCT